MGTVRTVDRSSRIVLTTSIASRQCAVQVPVHLRTVPVVDTAVTSAFNISEPQT
jgi:hypothetical protein